MADPFATLIAEYETYCAEQNLPAMSADELVAEMHGGSVPYNAAQHKWLSNFIQRWEEVENAER